MPRPVQPSFLGIFRSNWTSIVTSSIQSVDCSPLTRDKESSPLILDYLLRKRGSCQKAYCQHFTKQELGLFFFLLLLPAAGTKTIKQMKTRRSDQTFSGLGILPETGDRHQFPAAAATLGVLSSRRVRDAFFYLTERLINLM